MAKQTSKRKSRIIPIIVLVVVLILAVLVVAFFFVPDLRDSGMELWYPLEYESVIYRYSEEYNLDPYLVMGLICAESGFDPEAVSSAGAVGLMQIMPETAEWLAGRMEISYTEEDLVNPVYNIRMGCYYLDLLITYFDAQDTAIAAYNAGIGNVDGWLEDEAYSVDGESLDDIPFQETRDYVERVNEYAEIYFDLYGPDEDEDGEDE